MNIEVKGNSGCDIQIVDENNHLYVNKTTNDPSYTNRLFLQGEKQAKALTTDKISVPVVHVNKDNLIKMDYIYANNFIDFIERSPFMEIDNFIKAICEYIAAEIQQSEMTNISNDTFLDKLKCIEEKTYNNKHMGQYQFEVFGIFNDAELVFKKNETITIPIGICHGDLTFSNIMFSNSKYYLIDFLDSFIETPLQDIVKIRQDTQLYWSLLMYTKTYDSIRVKMTLDYIDKEIDAFFSNYDFYKYYNILQLMNILRIFPYVKSNTVAEYLLNTTKKIINTIEA